MTASAIFDSSSGHHGGLSDYIAPPYRQRPHRLYELPTIGEDTVRRSQTPLNSGSLHFANEQHGLDRVPTCGLRNRHIDAVKVIKCYEAVKGKQPFLKKLN